MENDFMSCGIQKLIAYKPFAIVKPMAARCHTLPLSKVRSAETCCFLRFCSSSSATAAMIQSLSLRLRKFASAGWLGRNKYVRTPQITAGIPSKMSSQRQLPDSMPMHVIKDEPRKRRTQDTGDG